MTHEEKGTAMEAVLQPIFERGFEGLGEVVSAVLNFAMLVEREKALGAAQVLRMSASTMERILRKQDKLARLEAQGELSRAPEQETFPRTQRNQSGLQGDNCASPRRRTHRKSCPSLSHCTPHKKH